jgi:hypothetical protein
MDGDTGEDGLPGFPGLQGPQGVPGTAGAAGAPGPVVYLEADFPEPDWMYIPGSAGINGSAGAPGPQGPAGPAIYLEADAIEPDIFLVPGPQGPQGTSGGGGGSVTLGAATITVPYGSQSYSGLVTDATVLSTSKILLQFGSYGDTAENDPEMDALIIHPEGIVAGSFNIEISTVAGLGIGGPFNFYYLVG